MNAEYKNVYYPRKLKEGLEYQDFVADVLFEKVGLPVVSYSSQKWQNLRGENRAGIEIKNDQQFEKTRRLWIELKEKADPDNSHYVPSGIHRDDNSWLYVIGDYSTIFIFSKARLRQIEVQCNADGFPIYPSLENGTCTSIGYLLPESHAEFFAAKVIYIEADQ